MNTKKLPRFTGSLLLPGYADGMNKTNCLFPTPDGPAETRRQILLVDDSRAQRRMLAIQLERAGYAVIEAASGAEALAYCEANEPDVILSDWMMPGMTGPEFCRSFRRQHRDTYGYFVLLTSKTEKDDITFGLESGADDFLTKPVSGAELLARLAAAERILHVQRELRRSNDKLQATLDQLHSAQDAMERDLAEARKLQQGLVRERSARFGAFDLSLLLRPAGHIGGDLVGFFPIDEAHTGIFGIDVSGHGVAAALLTAQLAVHLSGSPDQNMALRNQQRGLVSPAELAHRLNRVLLTDMQADTYFTMIYADLNHETGLVRMVQAGHPHPVVQRGDGAIELLGRGGMPIGLFERPEFDEFEVQLAPGDRMLLASDGIIETENPAGRLLGQDGLEAILRTNGMLHGHMFLESMAWSVSEYAKGERGDDVSAVLIEHRPATDPTELFPAPHPADE